MTLRPTNLPALARRASETHLAVVPDRVLERLGLERLVALGFQRLHGAPVRCQRLAGWRPDLVAPILS